MENNDINSDTEEYPQIYNPPQPKNINRNIYNSFIDEDYLFNKNAEKYLFKKNNENYCKKGNKVNWIRSKY